MRYDISKAKAPEMPNLGKGTECIKLLLSQASKDMYEPLVPMFFPVLGAHISGAEFQYPDLIWKEMCGQMACCPRDKRDKKRVFCVNLPKTGYLFCCFFCTFAVCNEYLAK